MKKSSYTPKNAVPRFDGRGYVMWITDSSYTHYECHWINFYGLDAHYKVMGWDKDKIGRIIGDEE